MATCAVNDKLNGGAGSIAEQLVQTKPDVLLGGGKVFFDQTVKAGRYKGLTVTQQAQVNGYQIVTDAAGLTANPCGQIGETVAFDAAIKKVLSCQKSHPDTLVVVTADHGHTGTEVRIAAGGPQAANVLGVTDQTDLFFTMKRALGIN